MKVLEATFKEVEDGTVTITATLEHKSISYEGEMTFEIDGRDMDLNGQLKVLKDLIEKDDTESFWNVLWDMDNEGVFKIENARGWFHAR